MNVSSFEHPSFVSIGLAIVTAIFAVYVRKVVGDIYERIKNSITKDEAEEMLERKIDIMNLKIHFLEEKLRDFTAK